MAFFYSEVKSEYLFLLDCARDKEMIFPEMRFEHPYTCDSGGNYVPLQTINGQAFCVDSDGFLTSDVVPEDRKCELTECVDQSAC